MTRALRLIETPVAEIYRYMHEAGPQSAAPSPDADLVERVARAIYASMHDDAPEWDRVKIIRAENGFKGDHSILQRDCLKAATAAIEALTATAPPSDSEELHPLDLEEIREQQFNAAMEASFRHGAQSMREMLARFVENSPPTDLKVMAGSMRANWYPAWGDDPGQTSELPRNALGDTDERDNRHSAFAARAVEHAMKLLGDSDAKGGGA
jgi:hypothetical protein